MFEEPIRRKTNAYPKDFTPPGSIRAVRSDTKQSQQDQFSFSGRKHHNNRLNFSVQLSEDEKEEVKHNLFTINPEDKQRMKLSQAEHETPLLNTHVNRRKPYINPELLKKPKLEENSNQELHVIGESDLESSMTPGSIRKNLANTQQPLHQEKPTKILTHDRQATTNNKVVETDNIFKESLRSKYINFTNTKAQKLAHLGRAGGSEPEGSFKTVKKNFSFSHKDINDPHSNLQLKRGVSEEKEKKKQLLGFGYLMDESKVKQLKNQINCLTHEKNKPKNPIKATQETQPDMDMIGNNSGRFNSKGMRKRRIMSNTKFYPELGNSYIRESAIEDDDLSCIETERNEAYSFTSPSLYQPRAPTVKVSYRTSLNSLKDIYGKINSCSNISTEITVPNILLNLRINPNSDKNSLYHQTTSIFEGLGIPLYNPTVKRYSNCILMVNKHICVLYHYNSKVYLGGWQNQYLDEGVKHGLGLEWVPNRYVYYGEFSNNKREGLGIMKTNEETFIGMWSNGKRTSEGLVISQNGDVLQLSYRPKSYRNDNLECLEQDPFLS